MNAYCSGVSSCALSCQFERPGEYTFFLQKIKRDETRSEETFKVGVLEGSRGIICKSSDLI
jgi:hypothetical protein